MAKKAKKTASWRTLARRAKKAASPTVAKRMRAKSAALRRADRAAKGTKTVKRSTDQNIRLATRAAKAWATRRANQMAKAMRDDREAGGLVSITNALAKQTGIDREPTQAWSATSWAIAGDRGLPGQGELVGGSYSQMADNIAKLARKKGGTDAIQNELAALAQASKYAGSVETDRAATKRLIEMQQGIADRIVCGFLAEVDERQRNGLEPSSTFTLSSFTVTKIVDALNKAGYRASGKT